MKTVSVALDAHLSGESTSLATCWLTQLVNSGSPMLQFGFTNHDRDILFQGVNYLSSTGYTATDVSTNFNLDIDNLDVQGMLSSPSITEDDLRAGLWDYAHVEIFLVNFADLTMGKIYQRYGTLGEVKIERGTFVAELLGLTQAYSTAIGQLTSPLCRYKLGDARCKVNLTGGSPQSFSVTGAITTVGADGVTLYDTLRTELGPTGGFSITGVTNANPGVVSTAGAHGFTAAQAISIYGVLGPALINTTTIALNPSGSTFQLSIDTSDTAVYPPYISGGFVTPLANSGFFDGGVITFTGGLNVGRSMEIKSYAPGQMILHLPMPYTVQVGDPYTMKAGCNGLFETCRDRFANVVNFGGEPDLPGIDKLIQVGRRS